MRKHIPVLIAAGLLAAVPGTAHAAPPRSHIAYDDCSIVTYGHPATAQESDCIGQGFPVGADTYTVETFPDGSTVVRQALITASGTYRFDYPTTHVQYGSFTIAVWASAAAFKHGAAPLQHDTFIVTPYHP